MSELDWEERGRRAREGLEPVRFLVGSWEGEGSADGQQITGRLDVRSILGDTFLEARERLAADGVVVHEDLCVYRYDFAHQRIRVTQFMAHAWVDERAYVEVCGNGIRWLTGPDGPRVELIADGTDKLVVQVWMPEQDRPATQICYRRVP